MTGFVNQRTEFVNEFYRSCEYCYEKYTSERLMTFILRGWAEHYLICIRDLISLLICLS